MKRFVIVAVLVAAVVWLLNTSLLATPPEGAPKILAHRGIHQTYPKDRQFLVNFKSRRTEEGSALAALLDTHSAWRQAVFGVYGGGEPTQETLKLVDGMRGYDRNSAVGCLARYIAYGWTGVVPAACQNTLVIVPGNYAPWLWGWPDRFAQRMKSAGSEIILFGPYAGGDFTTGIDSAEDVELVPERFSGYVWTNRAETIGPMIAKKQPAS
ncbi:hypothetical protein [Ensifer sp. 4252]|uniref:hypothetical protein n=1 Tax=Ensifer sp. 4252 TaxID=3373915 RepID=UPI003D21FF0B